MSWRYVGQEVNPLREDIVPGDPPSRVHEKYVPIAKCMSITESVAGGAVSNVMSSFTSHSRPLDRYRYNSIQWSHQQMASPTVIWMSLGSRSRLAKTDRCEDEDRLFAIDSSQTSDEVEVGLCIRCHHSQDHYKRDVAVLLTVSKSAEVTFCDASLALREKLWRRLWRTRR